ncbi:MAG: RNA polymerase sigma factor [Polyangiales bacterium]
MEHARRAAVTHRTVHTIHAVPALPATPAADASPTERANAAMLKYAQGDDAAFAELYRLLAPRLMRRCMWLAGQNDGEELFQEVFLKIHRTRGKFIDSGSIFAWAYAIARTTHVDRMRQRARRPETPIEPGMVEQRAAADDTCRPDARTALTALEGELDRELGLLSDNLNVAYRLVKLDGLSCADASARLGVPVDAVKQRVHRANEALKESFACYREAS